MKNKRAVYIVLPAVIGLWALVVYKVFQLYSPTNQEGQLHSSFVPPILTLNNNDTFSIIADYRDPFLGKMQAEVKQTKHNPAPPSQKIPVVLTWPNVSYGGVIKSRKSNEQVCMVSINGQSIFMKVGDSNADVQLKKIYNDSIEVVFNKQTKFIKK
jgi:hypothetical protein